MQIVKQHMLTAVGTNNNNKNNNNK